VDPVDELGVAELSNYSPVDVLTLSMKWAVNESPPHQSYQASDLIKKLVKCELFISFRFIQEL